MAALHAFKFAVVDQYFPALRRFSDLSDKSSFLKRKNRKMMIGCQALYSRPLHPSRENVT
jgi:hypothetical protein